MPDTLIPAQPVSTMQADSYVVVSLWRARSGDGESYDYETHATLNDALDAYADLEAGEHPRARAIGIFAARNGMPLGSRFDPHYIAKLLKETRAA